MVKEIKIPAAGKVFKNNVSYCVGTGRLGLALQKEYTDHLKIVQESIGFRYIRGHGLFCDDVGIYREYEMDGEIHSFYNFTYLDRIMDAYLENNIRPFLELGFMPHKLKSGEETIFYWKGNVTPPSSFGKWSELIQHTLEHLIERYGREEVQTWPVEVWNEPNIGFWAGSMEDYFTLYDYSATAVKKVDPRIQVGGPAICGIETEKWLRGFFEHCIEKDVPLDFITRHCYTANEPTRRGHYIYHTLKEPGTMIEELKETREIMKDYPHLADLPLHITEFNSSYVPVCPVHDTDFHAAYIARILSEAGEYADSYSYWTFSDVFEEQDVPGAVFHGGFGLLSLSGIKKPTFYAFEFFSRAGKELLYRDEHLLVSRDKDRYVLIGWNCSDGGEDKGAATASYLLKLPSLGKQALLLHKEVGGAYGNPLGTWSNLGKPRSPNREELAILQASAEPLQRDAKLFEENGLYEVEVNIPPNHLCLLEIRPVEDRTDTYAAFEEDFHWME